MTFGLGFQLSLARCNFDYAGSFGVVESSHRSLVGLSNRVCFSKNIRCKLVRSSEDVRLKSR